MGYYGYESYANYLTSSNCYKNLMSAKSKLNSLLTNLNGLKSAYSKSSGSYVTSVLEAISSLITIVESYISKIDLVIDGLTKNAASFDRCYENWKNKDFSKGYKTSNAGYGEKIYCGTNVYINSMGYVEACSEFMTSNNRNFGQEALHIITIGFAYMDHAGEILETKTATAREMLNS